MSDAYLGEIKMFSGPYCPVDYCLCDGALIKVRDNQALYSLLGTIYGGDSNTFALPDFRGRIPVHQGLGDGLSQLTIGTEYGTESETLTMEQIPVHSHGVYAFPDHASQADPSYAMIARGDASSIGVYVDNASARLASLADRSLESVGENSPHNNIMPVLSINFIICSKGLYPPRP